MEPGFFRTDFLDASSVQYGSQPVADHAQLPDGPRATYKSYNRQQPGDPVKLGQVVVQLACMPRPPLHFAAGSDALAYATTALERRQAGLQALAALSVSTDL